MIRCINWCSWTLAIAVIDFCIFHAGRQSVDYIFMGQQYHKCWEDSIENHMKKKTSHLTLLQSEMFFVVSKFPVPRKLISSFQFLRKEFPQKQSLDTMVFEETEEQIRIKINRSMIQNIFHLVIRNADFSFALEICQNLKQFYCSLKYQLKLTIYLADFFSHTTTFRKKTVDL